MCKGSLNCARRAPRVEGRLTKQHSLTGAEDHVANQGLGDDSDRCTAGSEALLALKHKFTRLAAWEVAWVARKPHRAGR